MANDRIQGVLKLTPLTPVHIGCGERYAPIDYAIEQGQFKVKDVRRFFEAHRDNPQYALDAVASGLKVGDDFIRYSLPFHGSIAAPPVPRQKPAPRGPQGRGGGRGPGPKVDAKMAKLMRQAERAHPAPPPPPPRPAQQDRGGEVAAFVKDPFDRFYLPASSVKGAIRTALACVLSEHIDPSRAVREATRDFHGRPPRAERAGGELNRHLFGEVIEDCMKAFVLRDSVPLAPDGFAITPVRVMNVTHQGFEEKRGMNIVLESLMPAEAAIELPFYLDTWRLQHDTALSRAVQGAGVRLLRDPTALVAALRQHGQALARLEANFYREQQQEASARFFEELAEHDAPCMPLGYGTGWHTKTVGRMLRPRDIETIRQTFGQDRHGKPNKRMGTPGVALFPKTRKWARGAAGWQPMGWLRAELVWPGFEDRRTDG